MWDVIHPDRRNLTIIRAFSRLGGHPDDPNSDPQDRSWFGPHDRLFRPEESEPLDFKEPPGYVWCWGWDGAGDIEGPDVEPVWEPLKNYSGDPRIVRHDRCESSLSHLSILADECLQPGASCDLSLIAVRGICALFHYIQCVIPPSKLLRGSLIVQHCIPGRDERAGRVKRICRRSLVAGNQNMMLVYYVSVLAIEHLNIMHSKPDKRRDSDLPSNGSF